MTLLSSTEASAGEVSNQVTVVVFKDNFRARTFQVPLAWLSRLGLALGACLGVMILTSVLSFRYYRVSQLASPEKARELEQELQELRLAYQALEQKSAEAASIPTQLIAAVAGTGPASSTAQPMPASSSVYFSALADKASMKPIESSGLPFRLDQIRAQWHGKVLRVHFNILYTSQDGGNQQGRIIILARGPKTLLAYPEGIINRAGSESLLNPDQGEYFSVSRFREVTAEFGPVVSLGSANDSLRDVEILIFNQNDELLLAKQVEVTKPAAQPKPATLPKPQARPKPLAQPQPRAMPAAQPTPSNEYIEPGVDQ